MASVSITPYAPSDENALDSLLFHCHYLHSHLDWFDALSWVKQLQGPIQLAWQDQRLIGVLAASPPLNKTCWLRLIALRQAKGSYSLLEALWHNLTGQLKQMGVQHVYVLTLRDWLDNHLQEYDFHLLEEVITLAYTGKQIPPPQLAPQYEITTITPADIPAIETVDHSAFAPPWQMSYAELQQARHIGALCRMAHHNGEPIGYQISTQYHNGAHLARLAVHHYWQGQGVGKLLIHDMMSFFTTHAINEITVNTQASNLRSQALYQTFGFQRNGHDLPVWTASLIEE